MECSEITETAVQELGILDLNHVPGDKVDVNAGCIAHLTRHYRCKDPHWVPSLYSKAATDDSRYESRSGFL